LVIRGRADFGLAHPGSAILTGIGYE